MTADIVKCRRKHTKKTVSLSFCVTSTSSATGPRARWKTGGMDEQGRFAARGTRRDLPCHSRDYYASWLCQAVFHVGK